MGCIKDSEEEYRSLVRDFVVWCHRNSLQLNTSKTKELVIDFRRERGSPRPVLIGGEEVELDWTSNTKQLYKKAQIRMYYLRRLRSFNICGKLLRLFYQSVVASVLLHAVVCWGGSISKTDLSQLEKQIRRASSVVGTRLDSLAAVAQRRTLQKLEDIMDNTRHPLHIVISSQESRWSLNGTLIDLGSDYRRHMSGGSLIIRNLDKDQDSGMYQCTAFNTLGSILSRRASIHFAYLDSFKTQSVRSAVNVREGQGVVLLCGAPPHSGELIFAWIFNEYPYSVQQDSRRFISQETGSLYIAKVEPSDVGNYTCVVNNTVTKQKVLSSPTPLVLRSDGKNNNTFSQDASITVFFGINLS
ncbi:PREDICTED: uncharacterized protein LOC106909145 [Poecilia mexicana]|uniref:uncharacterized protein LOC106909145 n=1 Tax=Poecilia mexicana TaxID=48701 RepID=UPI00072DBC14|nr:PREDICTED: uncharacterized protein LOC106909145 [Poecilia mexicana]